MPIYEYRCERGHNFEVIQSMSDDAITACTSCGATVQRVFHPVAVHFKGSGFYNTDYGKKNKGGGEVAKEDKKPDETAKPEKKKSSDSPAASSSTSD